MYMRVLAPWTGHLFMVTDTVHGGISWVTLP